LAPQWIVHAYGDLPGYVAFLQGGIEPHTDLAAITADLAEGLRRGTRFAHLSHYTTLPPMSSVIEFDSSGAPHHPHLGSCIPAVWRSLLPGVPVVDDFKMYCCAQMLVRADAVRRLPVEVYEEHLGYLEGPGCLRGCEHLCRGGVYKPGTRKDLACVYERLWHVMFTGPDSTRMECGRYID
jgi:hypothetical protein